MKLTWQRRRLQLRHPFNIARTAASDARDKEVLLVRIEHQGHIGWGEAAPLSYYQQSLDSAEAVFEQIGDELGDDPFAFQRIHHGLWTRFADQSAAIAAIDGALHDLIGQCLGIPLWRWLGLDRARLPYTSFTIGIDSPEVVIRKVAEAEPYPILKVKVGTERDEEVLELIRQTAPDKVLRVDANCAWTRANVRERASDLQRRFDLELIEQPTPAGDHDALPALRESGIGPLVADESCVGPADVPACVGAFDGINIKLSKCGGIRRALAMIHVARAAGLKIMLGCNVETTVGIAAAAHLGPLVEWLDLDGHLLLADDPFEGIGGKAGRLTLTDRPGLGIRER